MHFSGDHWLPHDSEFILTSDSVGIRRDRALKPAVGASESGEGGPGWDETHHLLDDEHPEKKHFAFQHFAK